ncbi:MAG: nodulation protein NfeD [Treponema sp.]|jgi:membrane-bound serine protease (ClpP class)|nr:nodulation protein NfeD [Treponema sp.]
MQKKITPLFLLFAAVTVFCQDSAPRIAPAEPALSGVPADTAKAWIIPIQGDIAPSLVTFVRREARKAAAGGAGYIIFEIDTFGGRVDSALQITSFIMSIKDARTVAWVRNSENSMGVSWSAGALIALSCADIYMAPGTSMGAAAPVALGVDGTTEATGEKTVAAVRSQIAALAERNGHPTGIALAMVDYDVELWEVKVEGVTKALSGAELERLEGERAQTGLPEELERIAVISPAGKLLSLTAGEAYRYGLARGLVEDRDALLDVLGAGLTVEESVPSAADGLIALLVSGPVQAVLILIGLVMVFMEIQSPGFGIPGTVAIIAFLLVFGSSALLGRVGSLELILFILGLGLLAIEIFVLPGFGVAGISGLVLIAFSLIFSMQDFIIPRFEWEWDLMGRNAMVVVLALIAAVTGIAVIALLGPKTKMFDKIMLKTQINETASEGGGWKNDGGVEADYNALPGKTGKALTVLRPIGKAVVDGETYQVEADGSFIEAGVEIKITRIKGNTIVVRSV